MGGQANYLVGDFSNDETSSSTSLELVTKKTKEDIVEKAIPQNKIFEYDLDTIKDKPWLEAGADITDYFNYGFNETTWKAYCEKQRETRAMIDKEDSSEDFNNDRDDERQYKKRRQQDDRCLKRANYSEKYTF